MPIDLADAVALARAVKEDVLETLRAQGLFEQRAVPVPEQKPQQASKEQLEAARAVLTAALSRLFTKESLAAQSAIKGKDFYTWRRDFYAKHLALVEKEAGPPVAVLNANGICRRAAQVAAYLCAESCRLLDESYNKDSEPVFKAKLEKWPSERAALEAGRIMGDT